MKAEFKFCFFYVFLNLKLSVIKITIKLNFLMTEKYILYILIIFTLFKNTLII
jgi:hypothetical protein